MKILRGALVFLVIACVFTFAECKKERNEETSTSTAEVSTAASTMKSASTAFTTTHPLPCMPSTATLCTDPCKIEVNVKDEDDSVEAKKVWVYEGQKIIWTPKPNHHPKPGDNEPKVEEVRFVDKTTTDAGKKTANDKPMPPANCKTHPTDCYMDATGFTRCEPYNYIAAVFHKNRHKKSDPEMEVGSTTSPFEDTTGTSGTSGTSGTH